MQTSEQLQELAAALVTAQSAIQPAHKDAENPAFKRDGKALRYAGLPSVVEAARPLNENGIAFTQELTSTEAGVFCATRLTHKSGQWMQFDPMFVPAGKRDAHGIGSAATYARRYSLCAAVGIVADEDDDANAASEPDRPKADPAYDNWLIDLEQVAIDGDGQALLDTVKKSKAEFRDRLRADVRTWNALKAKAAKGQAA